MRAARPLLALATTLTLLAGATAASARDADDPGSAGSPDVPPSVSPIIADPVAEALTALNGYRTTAGLPALVADADLDSTAGLWATQSATAGTSGPSPTAAADLAPLVLKGELYATGPSTTSISALVGLMDAGAPTVVRSATATRAGVGVATGAGGQRYLYIVLADDPFVDVRATDPFADEILWVVTRGVATGWPDSTFRPTASVTREAMAAFLYRFWDLDPYLPACGAGDPRPFTDVAITHPFCGAIQWLKTSGVSTGYPDGTFRPGAAVTREAMAAFLFRWMNAWNVTDLPIPTCDPGDTRMFTDVPAGHPFCGAIEWLATTGVADGWPDGTFRPGLTIERQAMAAFLVRLDAMFRVT